MLIETLCRQAKEAARQLARVPTTEKNQALLQIAEQLQADQDEILKANQADIVAGREAGLSAALLDRLMLNPQRLSSIIADLRHVTELPDPVGEVFDSQVLPNGLRLHKQRVPMGVLGIIYEARPNVTVDVAGLALKSGNCAILRGGSETIRSNCAISDSIRRALRGSAIPADAVQMITDTNRELVHELLQMDAYIDMIIPRGGAGLHDFCRKNSRIPVITGGIGICHLYVDESADLERAIEVIRNAKIQRPSVCNALDTVLIHQAVATKLLPDLVNRLSADGVTFRASQPAYSILKDSGAARSDFDSIVLPAGPQDFDTEWLALILGLKIVNTIDEAIDHIYRHSTRHSDGILTSKQVNADHFTAEVDSAVVYVNASTRFTDGAQLGLGAEVAVSTQKLHARGPMGLRELTTFKWIVEGDYHVRP